MKSLEIYRDRNDGYPCSGTNFITNSLAFDCTPAANSADLPIAVKSNAALSTAAGFLRSAVTFQPGIDSATSSIWYHVAISSGTTANRNGYYLLVDLGGGAAVPPCVVAVGNGTRPAGWSIFSVCTGVNSIQ
jgi:hypothetical protein